MKISVHVIHAFSVNGQGGNPAGVVFNADSLSAIQKQQVASLAGFAETAFVSASPVADYKLDFFTPTKQIPHCGHATIATFTFLKSQGMIAGNRSSKETIDGIRRIFFRDGKAYMEQSAPRFEIIHDDAVFSSLNISEDDLEEGLLPTIVNTGNSFLIIPIRNEAILSKLVYDRDAVYKVSAQYGLIGYYPYTRSVNFDATARMFAPFYGIPEESATGMAAGPLAAYLSKFTRDNRKEYRIEQGRLMHPPSPGVIEVELEFENYSIGRIYAGGGAHVARSVDVDV